MLKIGLECKMHCTILLRLQPPKRNNFDTFIWWKYVKKIKNDIHEEKKLSNMYLIILVKLDYKIMLYVVVENKKTTEYAKSW
jgi:hypothetical protein